MDIIQHPLPSDDYFQESCNKRMIVLHHTVGASAESSMHFWADDPRRVATAFVIERDGTVYQTFPAAMWAYHIGLGDKLLEKESIGIELASEGGLIEQDGRFYKFGKVSPKTQYIGPVYDNGSEWRGYRYFAEYTEEQVNAAIELAIMLCDQFKILPICAIDPTSYDPNAVDDMGITTHATLRRDKSDLHPGFPWHKLVMRGLR